MIFLVGHSMGSQVIYYFLKWAEASGEYYGNGGSKWCNDNIAAVVDISGSTLGAPKTIPALISGEMERYSAIECVGSLWIRKFFSRKERVDMLRTFGGVPSMLPKGGEVIWGNSTHVLQMIASNYILDDTIESNKTLPEGLKGETFGTCTTADLTNFEKELNHG